MGPEGRRGYCSCAGTHGPRRIFLISDYAQERDGVITHRSHGVYGYDSGAAEYTLAWFDGMGGGASLMPARGSFAGDSLVLHQSGPFGHFRYSYTATNPDKYTMLLEVLSDTEVWSVFLEGTYTRRPSD